MNFENFSNITLQDNSNPIFMTVKRNSTFFSSSAIKALDNVPYVKLMTNPTDRQILVIQNDSGISFKKLSKNVVWNNKKIINTIRELLPSDKKENVRIIGEAINVNGKKAILFSCDNLENIRSKYSKFTQ